jgi:hypothetical protein
LRLCRFVLLVPCFLLHRDDFGARTFTEPRASASGFSCGYAPLYYKILISSRAATISWWHKWFACHRRAVAGVWLRLCSFVLQDLDFLARRDDFLVGGSPVTAGCSRRLVAAMLLCGAAFQAADPISSGPAGRKAG